MFLAKLIFVELSSLIFYPKLVCGNDPDKAYHSTLQQQIGFHQIESIC